jgi:hypothetical protein
VVADLTPNFQIIVGDHADLPETWFRDPARHRWEEGVKLTPADWITAHQNSDLGGSPLGVSRHRNPTGSLSCCRLA